jgi:hypothetical protein
MKKHILLDYVTQYKNQLYFLNNICINVFGMHARPLWGANTNSQYILDPYAATSYCTSYLTKIDKYAIQEMKIIINKYKHEQT